MDRHAVSYQELIGRQQAAGFVGREGPLAQFRANLAVPEGDPARRLVFFIHGDGGVGKTSLMMRLRDVAAGNGALTAYLDESVFAVPDAMHAIAAELIRQGEPMKRFTRLIETYRQRRHEVETDHDAPPEAALFLTSTAVRVGLHAAKAVPGVGGLADTVDAAALAEQADRFRKFLGKKFRSHQDVAMLLSPAQALTPVFVQDLAAIGRRNALALFFDTYERTGPILDEWLIALLAGKYGALPPNLVITIAGRSPVDTGRWAPYLVTLADTPLAPFTEVEARQFLAQAQITDERVVEVMLAVSGRLPLLLATLAQNRPQHAEQIGDPSGDAVERFLKWETDEQRRLLAVAAALPRFVNEDTLAVLTGDGPESTELFAWLRAQPFVTHVAGRCHYHEVVRAAMIRLARGQSPARWRRQHHSLADRHQAWRHEISEHDAWSDPTWREHRLEETYHRLCVDGANALPEALSAMVYAGAGSDAVRGQWAQMLTQAGTDADAAAVRRWGERLENALLTDDAEVAYFDLLAGSTVLPTAARAEALRCRGRAHRDVGRYDAALSDFDRALELSPDDEWAIAGRGETYRLAGRYDEALGEFGRALELDPEDSWALDSRGRTYFALHRYDEALADFDRALARDPEDAWTVGSRGQAYLALDRYDEALADFDRAVALAPESGWTVASRGETYRLAGRYDEALADFDRAVARDPEDAWALGTRGQAYLALDRYDEALADLDRAIELEPGYAWAIADRGETYRMLDRYEEALIDFNRAIDSDPDYAWAIGSRGQTYRELRRYDEALADFDRAVALAPESGWTVANRGETYRLLGRYDEALTDFDRAIALRPDYAWAIARRGETYRLAGRYDEALTDLNRAVELDTTDDWYLYLCGLTQLARGESAAAATRFDQAVQLVQASMTPSSAVGYDDVNLVTYQAARNDPEAGRLLDELLAKRPNTGLLRECLDDLHALVAVKDTALARDLVARLEAHLA
jgi:tetratricopeptide (TPR) repeat protein